MYNAVGNSCFSSSDPRLSSTLLRTSSQSDTYRIEDPEIYHIAKMILMNDTIILDVSLSDHFQCIAEV
jgi:hypothetical protein